MATQVRDPKVNRAVRKRDNMTCQKCGQRHSELHVHHIKPLDAGGADAPDNCMLLCYSCHFEWESMYKLMPFEKWLPLPPASMLVALLLDESAWREDVSARVMREGLLFTHNLLREQRANEPRKGEPGYEDDE